MQRPEVDSIRGRTAIVGIGDTKVGKAPRWC